MWVTQSFYRILKSSLPPLKCQRWTRRRHVKIRLFICPAENREDVPGLHWSSRAVSARHCLGFSHSWRICSSLQWHRSRVQPKDPHRPDAASFTGLHSPPTGDSQSVFGLCSHRYHSCFCVSSRRGRQRGWWGPVLFCRFRVPERSVLRCLLQRWGLPLS